MHSFTHHRHSSGGETPAKETKGLVVNSGWRYDLGEWFHDTFSFHVPFRKIRQRTINLACLQPGETVLDVGCGTGTLALERHVAWAVRAASQALIQGRSKLFVLAQKRPGAISRSNSRSG
ncbi:hypothetical protein KSC_069640 [Ktedonobacter sp. SOSP1-52]|nr:class I SAM-dependent methyltransferase [Ktedonobacter sp. SOSP1-52]GHO68072.1 hypothetical protein KSC_069640 [Ktedonobacter sp. SOSP1-52]